VVSYVGAACEMGSCVWEMSISECPKACLGGACADVQCHADADCAPWPPTCREAGGGWYIESCPTPSCSSGTCECSPTITNCSASQTCSNAACSP
jgi:hypothetical protein